MPDIRAGRPLFYAKLMLSLSMDTVTKKYIKSIHTNILKAARDILENYGN